jgi:hypothetical protein
VWHHGQCARRRGVGLELREQFASVLLGGELLRSALFGRRWRRGVVHHELGVRVVVTRGAARAAAAAAQTSGGRRRHEQRRGGMNASPFFPFSAVCPAPGPTSGRRRRSGSSISRACDHLRRKAGGDAQVQIRWFQQWLHIWDIRCCSRPSRTPPSTAAARQSRLNSAARRAAQRRARRHCRRRRRRRRSRAVSHACRRAPPPRQWRATRRTRA